MLNMAADRGQIGRIPVVDIFCGAGGLGEGFCSLATEGRRRFDVTLSIDKEPDALATLRLRKFFHQFPPGKVPEEYYRFLRADTDGNLEHLKAAYPAQWETATARCLELVLGQERKKEAPLDDAIEAAIALSPDQWVLVGGPPCQAYSTAGRGKNRSLSGYTPEKDERHFLYEEYLRIIARYWPSVVIMENVTGILSSRVGSAKIFGRILQDLNEPGAVFGHRRRAAGESYRYRIYPLAVPHNSPDLFGYYHERETDFVIDCERFGVPQSRQRVILLAVRDDIARDPDILRPISGKPLTVGEALAGIPRLRSGISQGKDTDESWMKILDGGRPPGWFSENDRKARKWLLDLKKSKDSSLARRVLRTTGKLKLPRSGRGGDFVRSKRRSRKIREPLGSWLIDERIGGFCGHMTREHMPSDLYRYLFCAAFTVEYGRSPRLDDFPAALMPAHESASKGHYADRFRVQAPNQPASTVMSHIKNDGHYYIHPDPAQCRSLTPREAARLQSFPDNYYFFGAMGSKFRQIGNAVPPLLARQIGEVVAKLLDD
jgi:DNA (cytosine-5)-methyltransferase 1